MKKKPVLVALASLSVIVALALAGCGNGESAESGAGTGVEAQREAVAESEPAEGVGTQPGMYPPAFTLPDLDGADVSLSDYEGKVVVLDLWATWCPPCRQEIPFLVQLYEELGDEGLVVVGVGLDQGGKSALAPFVEKNDVTYPVLIGNREVQAAYGVSAIPTTFLIGRDGRIAAKHVGYDPSMADPMREEIVALLAGEVEA